MRRVVKKFLSRTPALRRTLYAIRILCRQCLLDPVITRKYRRRHPVQKEIEKYVSELDREGFVVIDNFFDSQTLEEIIQESNQIVARVASQKIRKEDLTLAPSGSYRLHMSDSYSAKMERLFFSSPFLESLGRYYFGGQLVKKYNLFQVSYPLQPGMSEFGTAFHFDHEMRTLKAFLYVSDVDHENGPLIYCPRSKHIAYDKLKKMSLMYLLDNSDATFYTAEEAQKLKLGKQAISITGKKGTLVLVDTRGYHKAGPITKGQREVFVAYFARKWPAERVP